MNFNGLDLNLLVALDALISEKSVTRASERLCVTQPALSGSLQRLREYFDDQLLARIGRQMELTPKAQALAEPLRQALLQIQTVLDTQPMFDPNTAKRSFRIVMSDFCAHIYLPHLVRRLASAPGIRCIVEPIYGTNFERLEAGDLDIVITHSDRRLFGIEKDREVFSSAYLFSDEFVCAVATDHPVRDRMTIADYQHYPHAVMHFGPTAQTIEKMTVRQLEIDLLETVLLPGFSALLHQLPQTKLIATVPRKLALQMADNNIRILPPPIKLPRIDETVIWHNRNAAEPGHRWLREKLQEAATALVQEQ